MVIFSHRKHRIPRKIFYKERKRKREIKLRMEKWGMNLARWRDGEMVILATENTEYTERFFTKRKRKRLELKIEN